VKLPELERVAIVERAAEREEPAASSGMQVSRGYRRFFVNKNYLRKEEHGECLR
jgi:hypothetical protein